MNFVRLLAIFWGAICVVSADNSTGNSLDWLLRLYNPHTIGNLSTHAGNVSDHCLSDMNQYLDGLRDEEFWAAKMMDASGRFTSQFFYGNNFWLGSMALCDELSESYKTTNIPSFPVRFSVARLLIKMKNLTPDQGHLIFLGLCFPVSCSAEDVRYILTDGYNTTSGKASATVLRVRLVPGGYQLLKDKKFLALGGSIFAVAFLMIIGTLFECISNRRRRRVSVKSEGVVGDVENNKKFDSKNKVNVYEVNKKEEGDKKERNGNGEGKKEPKENAREFVSEFFSSFSIFSNSSKILNCSRGSEGSLNSVHGLRFLSLAWVIMVHTYLQIFAIGENKTLRMHTEKRFLYQTVGNATYSVDSFFLISGLLVSYLFFKNIAEEKSAGSDAFRAMVGKFVTLVLYRFIRSILRRGLALRTWVSRCFAQIPESTWCGMLLHPYLLALSTDEKQKVSSGGHQSQCDITSAICKKHRQLQKKKKRKYPPEETSGTCLKNLKLQKKEKKEKKVSFGEEQSQSDVTSAECKIRPSSNDGIRECGYLTTLSVQGLTPVYMVVLGLVHVTMTVLKDASVFETPLIVELNCDTFWWRNLLYINNFFPKKEMCMLWSWYMAADTQFFILSSMLLLVAKRYFKFSAATTFAILVSSWFTTAFISYTNQYEARVQEPLALFDELYDKPWTRIGPYIVGMAAGWYLQKNNCRINMPIVVVVLGWLASIACLASLVYGTRTGLNVAVSTAYAALGHTAWGLSLAWMVVACSAGYGGWIDSILSWPAFYPLSRLTYCAYLVHPVIMFLTNYVMDGPFHMHNGVIFIVFFGNLVASFMLSFLLSIAFEAPFVRLLKLVLSPTKKR